MCCFYRCEITADYRHYYVGKDGYTAIVFSNRDFKAIPILKDIQNLISKQ